MWEYQDALVIADIRKVETVIERRKQIYDGGMKSRRQY